MRLRKLLAEEAFYFFTSIGNYTGESADSLEEFAEKIKEISTESLKFHLYRCDFEEWISGTLGDEKLTKDIENLRNRKLSEKNLRSKLYRIISKRLEKQKKKPPKKKSKNDGKGKFS